MTNNIRNWMVHIEMKQNNKALIKILSENENMDFKAKDLANELGVSIRSIKNYIQEINDNFPDSIISSRSGYRINKETKGMVMEANTQLIPQTSKERVIYIINSIIKQDEPVDVYDLCDEMYISLSTIKLELNKVKRKISKFNLELINSNDRLTIAGQEKDKRKLLSTIIYNESNVNFVNLNIIQDAFIDIDIVFIKNTIVEIFDQYHYFINDYSLINLVLHITIAIDRIRNNNSNTQNITELPAVRLHEYELSKKLVERLEKKFDVQYSDGETYELALLLISRATAIDYKNVNSANIDEYIGTECLGLVKELISKMNSHYCIDLKEQEFFIRFALHIRNLLIRSKNNYFSKNPLAEGIKTSCPLIYEISVFLASIIKERTGITINDDEIAYIAFHLGSALEAQKNMDKKVTAVIYCPNYYDMKSHLIETINHNFKDELVITNILMDESELEIIQQPDVVIATIPLTGIVAIPVVNISIFLNSRDITNLRHKLDMIKKDKERRIFKQHLEKLISPDLFEIDSQFESKDKLIPHMVAKLVKNNYVETSFLDEIYEREKMSSTAYNLFAIPHSMKMQAKKTGLNVFISKKPTQWDAKEVSLVIMLCFNPDERHIFNEIFEPITMILSNTNNIQELVKCDDYSQFIETMTSMLES